MLDSQPAEAFNSNNHRSGSQTPLTNKKWGLTTSSPFPTMNNRITNQVIGTTSHKT
jgi:hypothetical protein